MGIALPRVPPISSKLTVSTRRTAQRRVASGAAYLVETDRFDPQDGTEARYAGGVPKTLF